MVVFKRFLIFIVVLISACNMAMGQEKELKQLTYPDFLKEVQKKTGVDTIRDIELVPGHSDTSYWYKVNSEGKGVDYDVKIKELHVNCSVVFENCKIDVWADTKLIFCDTLNETDTIIKQSIKFNNCDIKLLYLTGNFRWLTFTNCKIRGLNLERCHINFISIAFCNCDNGNRVNFRHCTLDCFPVRNTALKYNGSIDFASNQNLSVFFYECLIDPGKRSVLTSIGGGPDVSFENLVLRRCEFFKPVSFDAVKVNRIMIIDNVKFDSNVSFEAFESPGSTTLIDWKDIGNRFFVNNGAYVKKTHRKNSTGNDSVYYETGTSYYAKKDSELLDEKQFNSLMSSYNFFTSLYTSTGDEEARNAVYLEKKRLLTARSGALSHKYHSAYYFITYQLNRFLSWFCDYATNPVRAIINCLKMMLYFALVFFIFPSQPDHLEKYRFMKYFKRAIEYFSTDKSLADLHKEAHREHLMELEHFKLEMKKSKKLVPIIVTSLGQLFYLAHHSVFTLFNKTLLSIDVSKKSWIHVSKGKKVVLGIFTGVYFIGYVINGIITRAVNAIMLSLNSFVTLGAAGIETTGIAKVFTVIEGSIGWFFLAILTVTLITQLLQ
jgi:hypothetical protein